MRRPSFLALGLLLVLPCPTGGVAQTIEEERRIEEKARMALEPTELAILKGEKRLVMDYGIWINHLLTDFRDDDNDSAASDATDATYALDQRVWVRATLRPPVDQTSENEHSVYLRLKDQKSKLDALSPGDGQRLNFWRPWDRAVRCPGALWRLVCLRRSGFDTRR